MVKQPETPKRRQHTLAMARRALIAGFRAQLKGRTVNNGGYQTNPVRVPRPYHAGRVRRAWVYGWNMSAGLEFLLEKPR